VGVILETVEVTRSFGAVKAADNLSLRLEEGQVVGIVGPNGSGKTTFVNIVTGYVKPAHGRVLFRGQDITRLSPREVTARGIARSFQVPQLYTHLTILENVLVALSVQARRHWDFWRPLRLDDRVAAAHAVLDQFGFKDGADQQVLTLPEGGRKVLDVALSFALQPSVLLLDEPTSGVSVEDKFGVMDTLMQVVKASGVTAVFVEHDMDVVARYADRVVVFAEGRILANDRPEAVFADPAVRLHVLGEGV
jgi:branched-chain amino acid transport system ATP-binding protein